MNEKVGLSVDVGWSASRTRFDGDGPIDDVGASSDGEVVDLRACLRILGPLPLGKDDIRQVQRV